MGSGVYPRTGIAAKSLGAQADLVAMALQQVHAFGFRPVCFEHLETHFLNGNLGGRLEVELGEL